MALLDDLKAPFDPARIHFRVGSMRKDHTKAIGLAYIDARDVMERLDAVVGPMNWQRTYSHVGDKTCCEISIRFGDGVWVTKSDGAGDTDIEGPKGAFSDSFKRAAVNWGIGRYLYDLPNTWVDIEPFGRSYKITDKGLEQLRRELKAHTKTFDAGFTVDPTQTKKSAYAARNDGDFERFKTEIFSCETTEQLEEWMQGARDELAKQPDTYKSELRGIYQQQKERLAGLQPPIGV